MTSEQPPDPASSLRAARAYDRGRARYPREAADWLVGGQARTVLELGAGTGQLTRLLAAAGHDVHATDPNPEMLTVLAEHLPGVRASSIRAEEIAVPPRSVDVVACAASFHLFDVEVALPAIARALRPGGHLAVVWSQPDARIPWVRRLSRLLGDQQDDHETVHDQLAHSPLFSFVEEKTFKAWQDINVATLRDVVLSRSRITRMSPGDQESRLAEVRDLYDEYGRGMDGMQLPFLVRCLRSQVVHQPGLFDDGSDAVSMTTGQDQGIPADPVGDRERAARRQENFLSDGTDTDMLLIDFR